MKVPQTSGTPSETAPEQRRVGYGCPPAEHQFKKGQSGNPRGRPKRSKKAQRQLDPSTQPTERLILAEAYRPVTVREGDKTIELPAIQAAMRALVIAAMKGSRLSQKALTDIVRAAETRERTETIAAMEAAIEYKQNWGPELARLSRTGEPEPLLLPHPDDIEIDFRNGGVIVSGPMNAEEKASHDKRVARRDDAQAEVSEYAKRYRSARDPKKKQMWLEWWHQEQMIYDLINDGLKGRYKRTLEDRSFHPGASREGKAAEHYNALRSGRNKTGRKQG
jgi:hypothetical protein